MTSPYEPPAPAPELVPPNRKPGGGRSIAIWLVLVVVFVAAYQVLQTPPVERPAAPTGPAWPWAIPVAAMGASAAGFVLLRRRLPAKYRSFELRRLAREAPPSPPRPAPLAAVELRGTDGQRPVVLRVSDAGLSWNAEARLLRPAQALEVGWDELTAIGFGWRYSTLPSFGLVGAIVGGIVAVRGELPVGLGIAAVGAGAWFAGRRLRRGTLSFVTDSHALTFESRALDDTQRGAIEQGARARRPTLFATNTVTGWRAVGLLFGRPFTELAAVWKSDAALREELYAGAEPVTTSAEDQAAGLVQRRLYGLWFGTVGATLPCAVGLAAGLSSDAAWTAVPAALLTWVAGLVVAARSTPLLARITGMSVLE